MSHKPAPFIPAALFWAMMVCSSASQAAQFVWQCIKYPWKVSRPYLLKGTQMILEDLKVTVQFASDVIDKAVAKIKAANEDKDKAVADALADVGAEVVKLKDKVDELDAVAK